MHLFFSLVFYLSSIGAVSAITKFYNHHNDSNPAQVYLDWNAVDSPAELKSFRVALITAGSVRSFLFNEKSWQRYILDPWKDNIFVFAHVISNHKKCEITNKGIDALREISTEIEVGFTSSTLLQTDETVERLGNTNTCLSVGKAAGQKPGNILDMYARRSKAYGMAQSYGQRNNIKWDMYFFVRLDSAFYAPKIELLKYHHALLNHTKVTGQRTIIIPNSCNFGGYCDRFAAGLPAEMDVFFNRSLLYRIADWAEQSKGTNMTEIVAKNQHHIISSRTDCGSETMLMIWLQFMNNIRHGFTIPHSTAFITLRTLQANKYCAMSRTDVGNCQEIIWTDKTSSIMVKDVPVASGFDLVSNPYERCGLAYKINVTSVCMDRHCNCGKSG